MNKIISFYGTERRYQSLRIIGTIFIVLGAVLLAIGAVLMVFGLYTFVTGMTGDASKGVESFPPGNTGVVSLARGLGGAFSLLWSFGFLLTGLEFIAAGVLFGLLIHLEENSRTSAQFLDKIRMRLESRGEDAEPFLRL